MEKIAIGKSASREIPTLTMRDMVRPLFHHRKVVLATFVFLFLASLVVAWVWADRYWVATMQIVVDRARIDPAVTSQPIAAVQENNKIVTTDDVESEVALLQGKDMLREVAADCGLPRQRVGLWSKTGPKQPGTESAAALERATKALSGSLKVEAQKASRVIDLRYGSTDSPETAACVLQALSRIYLEKHLRLQRPAGALDFFTQETEKYQKALTESENRLVKFSEAQGVAAPEVLRTSLAQQLVLTESSLHQTEQAIAADKQRIQNVRDQLAQTPARSSTAETSLAANTLLEQLHSSLLASQLKRTQLLMKFDPSYPLVKEVDQEIAETNKAIGQAENSTYVNTTTDRDPTFEFLRQDEAKTQADLAADTAKADALKVSIHEMQLQMVSLDARAVQQEALLREAKANEGNYLLYLTKREQERTSDALDDKRIANVAIAVPPEVPTLPAHSPISITFFGFWLSLAAAVLAGYLVDLVDPSFRTPSEVQAALNLPILAAVPKQVA